MILSKFDALFEFRWLSWRLAWSLLWTTDQFLSNNDIADKSLNRIVTYIGGVISFIQTEWDPDRDWAADTWSSEGGGLACYPKKREAWTFGSAWLTYPFCLSYPHMDRLKWWWAESRNTICETITCWLFENIDTMNLLAFLTIREIIFESTMWPIPILILLSPLFCTEDSRSAHFLVF